MDKAHHGSSTQRVRGAACKPDSRSQSRTTSGRAPTARWMEAAFCQSSTCQPLHHVDHRCLLSSPRCPASYLAAESVCVCVCVCTRARVGWRAGVQMKERMNHRQTQTGEPPNDPNSFIQQTLPEYLQCINPQDRRGRPADHPAATGAWLSPHPQPLAEAAPTLGQCRTTSPPSFTSVPAVAHGRCLIRAYQNRSPSPSPCRKQVVV